MVVPSGDDDIIILRRVDGSCQYSFSSSVIPRELSEAEMIQKTRRTAQKKIGNDVAYWMLSTLSGVCIYLKNNSSSQAYSVKFGFQLTNLRVKGMRPDQTEITL